MNTLPVKIKEVVELSKIEDLTKAEKIAFSYAPLMNEVTEQGDLIKQLKIGNEEDVEKAKRIKLDLGKICSRASQQKTIDKEIVLLESRFIDALFNTVNGAARLNQEEAKEIEQHFANIEKQRIDQLQLDREIEIRKYSDVTIIIPDFLGAMDNDTWVNYLAGNKVNYETKIEAEKAAEKKRIEAAEKEATRIKQLAIDNAKLKKEADIKEKQRIADEKERQRLAKIEANKIEKERQIQQAKIDAAKKEADNLAAQLEAKKQLEIKAENDRIAKIESELSKGDVAKINDLKTDLIALKTKYEFKSKKNQLLYQSFGLLIEKIINFINK